MKVFEVWVPLIANVRFEVEAEDEGQAWELADEIMDHDEIETFGFDPEPFSHWEITEIKK